MRFNKHNDRTSKEGIKQGFSDSDTAFLNRQTDTPKIQIWDDDTLEDENPTNRAYFCATCKSKLDYVKKTHVWRCDNCMEYYDPTLTQDGPLKDVKDFKLTPYTGLQYYPQYDENDNTMPFVEAINLNKEDDIETREHDNSRIQTIHVKGSFTDAIHAGVLSAKKKDEDE